MSEENDGKKEPTPESPRPKTELIEIFIAKFFDAEQSSEALLKTINDTDIEMNDRAFLLEQKLIEYALKEGETIAKVAAATGPDGKALFTNAETRRAEVVRRMELEEGSELTAELRDLRKAQKIDEIGQAHRGRVLRFTEARMANARAVLHALSGYSEG